MSMSGDDAYVLAMDYVDETLEGGGALKGDDGKSAYQSWLDLGNTGTEEDFINSLKGDGTDGFSPVITENSNNTYEDYRLDIETKESKFTTPNLKADIRKNIAEHNTSPDSHNDIRIFFNELNNRLNALANSDDETLDEMKEVVAYIKDNRSLIESITTTKVNVSDIIDNLTTNVSNKPLSASQGVVIKNLIDTLQSELTAHVNNFNIHVTPNDKTNWNNATDKINNLEVGGRNLLLNTSNDIIVNGGYVNYSSLTVYKNLEKGETYTFSAELTIEGSDDKRATISMYNEENASVNPIRICQFEGDGERHSVTFTALENFPDFILYAGVAGATYGVNAIYHNAKLEKGNVATDWTPAPEDKIEITDVNGLQPIADNNQSVVTNSRMSQIGWYRIAKYEGEGEAKGTTSNSCDIRIKRQYYTNASEHHHILLKSKYFTSSNQEFKSISSNSAYHIITKIRYVYNDTAAYIDVFYNGTYENNCYFEISHGKSYKGAWQTITPTLVAESTEGETISTVFDIPTNANPVTDLDLTINAIQGLREELDELRSLITNS